MGSMASINGLPRVAGRTASAALVAWLILGLNAPRADAQESRLSGGSHCANRIGLTGVAPSSPLDLELLTGREQAPRPFTPGRPCSGPTCSKSPATPAPAPLAPPPAPTPDPWAHGAGAPTADLHRLLPPASEDAPARPTHLAAGIFHPPR